MDKTTRQMTPAVEEPWPLRALRHMLDLTPARIVGPPQPWSARPAAQRPSTRGRYPAGMHAHAMPELCAVLSGRPFLDVQGRRFALRPSCVAILPPQVAHCEGWTNQREPYEVSWLSPSEVSVHITRVAYHPRTGWTIRERHLVIAPAARDLLRLLGAPGKMPDQADVPLLRAGLLAIFAQLHQQMICQSLQSPPANRAGFHQPTLEQVKHLLDHHLDQRWSLAQLANLTRLTPNYLNRLFKQWTGRGIHQYLTDRRMGRATQLLGERRWLIKEIARHVGYDDPLYFSRTFHRHHGYWPTRAPAAAGARQGNILVAAPASRGMVEA